MNGRPKNDLALSIDVCKLQFSKVFDSGVINFLKLCSRILDATVQYAVSDYSIRMAASMLQHFMNVAAATR